MNKETKNIKKLIIDQSFELDCGKTIKNFPLAYETYGSLNKNKSNAILAFHALTGDQFCTNINPITKREGWWATAVGPDKAIDTNKYFVICANVLGGCMGTYGPKEINPETNKIFGTTFPVITIRDMVKAQKYLLDHFGINKLLAVIGGSMGGMQVLQFASLYPEKSYSAIPIACSASHSAQNIALNELGRQAIMADPNWKKENSTPDKGLAVARMAAHITYLSKKGLQEKFGRKLQDKGSLKFSFDADFQIESYLRYQGSTFVDRFDANSYLYITRAMDYFDLEKQFNGNLSLAKKNKKLFKINSEILHNEGFKLNKEQKLWKRATAIILGGNSLLSKNPDLFLPNKWPTYFTKSKGCKIWDLNNVSFIDMSLMGVGTNILGYCNSEVDNAVKKAVNKGNSTTLNCPEEVFLAEKLLNIHPWAGKVKFARTGGEASAIAVRIARAASKKDKIAFCGYHGWHDWYLSANISNKKNLDKHLLSGLKTSGVPNSLKNTSFPFNYNDFESLKKITDNNDIGVIIMEVERNMKPKNNFLKKIRDLATKKNIVLVFDEITSGFRETFGGLHKNIMLNLTLLFLEKHLEMVMQLQLLLPTTPLSISVLCVI